MCREGEPTLYTCICEKDYQVQSAYEKHLEKCPVIQYCKDMGIDNNSVILEPSEYESLLADRETLRMLDWLMAFAKDTYSGYGHVSVQEAGDGLFYAWLLDEDERVTYRVDGLDSRVAAIRALHREVVNKTNEAAVDGITVTAQSEGLTEEEIVYIKRSMKALWESERYDADLKLSADIDAKLPSLRAPAQGVSSLARSEARTSKDSVVLNLSKEDYEELRYEVFMNARHGVAQVNPLNCGRDYDELFEKIKAQGDAQLKERE